MTERRARPAVRPKSAVQPATATISPARSAAFDLLLQMESGSAHSDDLLHGPRLDGLSQADRNLTMTLVLGSLRWQIALDARIRPLLQRPEMRLAEPVAVALRLGALQLLHLERIPAHAALNESVELVRAAGHAHAAGMVNAILRKLAAAPPPRATLAESPAALADRLGHPLWIVERWIAQYGRQATERLLAHDQQPPPAPVLFAASDDALPVATPILDDGSRLVAELAAAAQPNAARIWDACAAPGGKTQILALRHPSAELLATDASAMRLKRMSDRLAREFPGHTIHTEAAPAQELSATHGSFDLILCDVPCSGTGTLARNPEIRHRLQRGDLARQAERQQAILAATLRRLAPGGRLLYSTCSMEPEENEAVLDGTLATLPAEVRIAPVPLAPVLTRLRDASLLQAGSGPLDPLLRGDHLRTLPGSGFEGDGFFAALFERQ